MKIAGCCCCSVWLCCVPDSIIACSTTFPTCRQTHAHAVTYSLMIPSWLNCFVAAKAFISTRGVVFRGPFAWPPLVSPKILVASLDNIRDVTVQEICAFRWMPLVVKYYNRCGVIPLSHQEAQFMENAQC